MSRKQPFVARSIDYGSITRENFVEITQSFNNYYYHMLMRFGVYGQPRFQNSHTRFWHYIWQRKDQFDRSRGRLSTWLFYPLMRWIGSEKQALAFGICKDEMGEFKLDSKKQNRHKRFYLLPSGLNPAVHSNKDGDQIERDVSLLSDSPEDEIALRQLVSLLPEEDQRIIELRDMGYVDREVAQLLGIPGGKFWWKMKQMRKRLRALMDNQVDQTQRKSHWNFGSYMNKTYWNEYFRTYRQSFPIIVVSQEELDSYPVFKP